MQLTIDRFEGQFAICEKAGGGMIKIPRHKIPAEAREGDALWREGISFSIDAALTATRKKAAEQKFQKLQQTD